MDQDTHETQPDKPAEDDLPTTRSTSASTDTPAC